MNYNRTDLWPPGPMIAVIVYPLGNRALGITVLGKLDTGADICVIPQSLVDALRLEAEDLMQATGFDSQESEVTTYFVDLEIAGYSIEAVEVVAAPHSTMLIGRDVFSHFVLTLNGKKHDV